MQIGAMRAHRNTMPNPAVQGLMASPSATAGAHLRTLALLCLIVSYDLSWVVRLLFSVIRVRGAQARRLLAP